MKQPKAGETARILRISDWDANYENNRTRDLKHMAWIPVSNKHDGDGYTTLIDHKDGAAHLGCWLAILQVASKCEPRGTLVRDNGRPHDATSISRLTRLPATMIQETINRCLCDEVGWLQVVDTEGNETIPQEGARIPQATDYGTEVNGTEKKEINIAEDKPPVLEEKPIKETEEQREEREKAEREKEARKWALGQSRKLIEGVSLKIKKKLTSKPTADPILKLIGKGVSRGEVEAMIDMILAHSGEDYFPVVQSSKALNEKWDKLLSAQVKFDKPKEKFCKHQKIWRKINGEMKYIAVNADFQTEDEYYGRVK